MRPPRLALALAFGLAACGAPPSPASSPSAAPPHPWTYEGDEGPARWGDLTPELTACKLGTRQSPIDLPSTASADPALSLSVRPAPQPLVVRNTGHVIQVDATSPSWVTLGGSRYDLVELHFHSPSEHTVDGARFAAELDLLHRSAEGKLLVVGVLLKSGQENPALKALWEAMPETPNERRVVAGEAIEPTALLPRSGRYLRYDGSLTMPPCTEGVTWLVALPEGTWSTEISEAQIARLRALTHGATNRPAQPANGRSVRLVVAR